MCLSCFYSCSMLPYGNQFEESRSSTIYMYVYMIENIDSSYRKEFVFCLFMHMTIYNSLINGYYTWLTEFILLNTVFWQNKLIVGVVRILQYIHMKIYLFSCYISWIDTYGSYWFFPETHWHSWSKCTCADIFRTKSNNYSCFISGTDVFLGRVSGSRR